MANERAINVSQATQIARSVKGQLTDINGRLDDLNSTIGEDHITIMDLDSTVRTISEDVVAKKNIETTAGVSISTSETMMPTNIPSGANYVLLVTGDETILPNGFNFYVNGNYKNGSRQINTEYEHTAESAVTRVSIYAPSKDVAKTGSLQFKIIIKTTNNNSIESRIANVESVKDDVDKISEVIAPKNLFAESNLNKSGITFADGAFTGNASAFSGSYMIDEFEENTQYTISLTAYNTGSTTTNNGLAFGFKYTDGTYKREYFPNDAIAYTHKAVTTDAGKTVKNVYFGYASGGSNVWCVKEIQVEKSKYETPYVSPNPVLSAVDIKTREDFNNLIIRPWYEEFEAEPLRIAYSAIWVDKINTVTHWLFASDMGFNALKGDVEITSDGKLIMCHDPGFTFDSNGRIIAYDSNNKTLIVNMTYAECMSKVYAETPERYGGYCPVADIDDFITVCKEKGKICFVTIRGTNTDDVVNAIADKIKYYGMESRTIINALSVSILKKVRANPKCDSIAINLVAPEGVAITIDNVDSCLMLGRCFLNIWNGSSSTSVIDNSAEAIAYAKAQNVPLLGIAYTANIWNYLIEKGVLGAQVYKPIFDVEPHQYVFVVKTTNGTVSFGNLFDTDRYTGIATLIGSTITVSDIKISGSPFAGVVDGIQPIKMNLLYPVIRCIDWDKTEHPVAWKNNALEITVTNTDDNRYTVIVNV